MADEPAARLRLDKWLWRARFGRTRSKSAGIVRSGHVRLNGARVTDPGKGVKCGDVLTIAMPGRTHVVRVAAFGDTRGDAEAAHTLYDIMGS